MINYEPDTTTKVDFENWFKYIDDSPRFNVLSVAEKADLAVKLVQTSYMQQVKFHGLDVSLINNRG